MSANRFLPHVLVLPEDDRDREIAIGFKNANSVQGRRIQVLRAAGGWNHVLSQFELDHIHEMHGHPNRLLVLVIDFDGFQNRFEHARSRIPDQLADRVFILGVWSNPEQLRPDFTSYESIGKALADDCDSGTDTTWGHRLLRHNADEVHRLRERAHPFLFSS